MIYLQQKGINHTVNIKGGREREREESGMS